MIICPARNYLALLFFELSLSRHRSLNNSCGLNPHLEFSGLHYCLFVKEHGDYSPNGEGGIWTLAPLLTTCTLSRGVPSTSWVLLLTSWINKFIFSYEGLAFVPQTERVGFEPTRPCGQTVFKTASLWPLRYLSKRCRVSCGKSYSSKNLSSCQHIF